MNIALLIIISRFTLPSIAIFQRWTTYRFPARRDMFLKAQQTSRTMLFATILHLHTSMILQRHASVSYSLEKIQGQRRFFKFDYEQNK